MTARIITLLTDFGTADAFVGIMKGVILGINPDARVVDLTHAVPPQQILPAALVLRSAVGAFPAGTIHVVVVDPGVGSARRPILVETDAGVLIGPDNGVLSLAALAMGRRRARSIDNQELLRHPISHTFHGRDVFAPVAAHLSRGAPCEQVGSEVASMTELTLPPTRQTASGVSGEIVYVDHFGNLVTNIAADAIARFPAQQLSVSIGGKPVVELVTAYAAVPDGMPLAIVGSWGVLEIAVRNGNAARMLAAGPGTPVTVVVESGST